MITKFIDPYDGTPLCEDSDGNLRPEKQPSSVRYKKHDGCFDFVSKVFLDNNLHREREFHDKLYSRETFVPLELEKLKNEWFDWMSPWRSTLLKSLGELPGKKILLVGNGEETKEMYFAAMGANVIYTDLSIEAVMRRKKQYESSEISRAGYGNIDFHAIDALHLPFPDDSFDIIYGAAVVHHLDDVNQFFKEVYRCLRPSGICRFLDQAYSPIWRGLSTTVLLPLKKLSYWQSPRSLGDIRSDEKGGLTEESCRRIMNKHGFTDMFYEREYFFYRIAVRHYRKLVNYNARAIAFAKPFFRIMMLFDLISSKTHFMKNNSLVLTWGFNK